MIVNVIISVIIITQLWCEDGDDDNNDNNDDDNDDDNNDDNDDEHDKDDNGERPADELQIWVSRVPESRTSCLKENITRGTTDPWVDTKTYFYQI